MGLAHSPRIVTDGLVLALDAGNTKSYPGSGATWTDLSGKENDATLTDTNGIIIIVLMEDIWILMGVIIILLWEHK